MDNPYTFAFVMGGMFVFYAWVAWIILEGRKTSRKVQLHKALIERFPSSAELQGFLSSEGGDRWLRLLSLGGLSPKEKILASFSRGAIVAILGVATLAVSLVLPAHRPLFVAGGILVIALGAGLIVAGFLSLKLGKKFGLIDS